MNRLYVVMSLVVWGVLVTVGMARQVQAAGPVRVVVWDERQPRQKQAYPEFLGEPDCQGSFCSPWAQRAFGRPG